MKYHINRGHAPEGQNATGAVKVQVQPRQHRGGAPLKGNIRDQGTGVPGYQDLNIMDMHVQCTVYSVQCTMHNAQCTLCSVQCTVYSVQCTVHMVQCIVHNVHRAV